MADGTVWHHYTFPEWSAVNVPTPPVHFFRGWIFNQTPSYSYTPEQEQQYREAQKELREQQAAAELKAQELFLSKLTEEQRQSLESQNGFLVLGSQGNQYWISCSSTIENVYLMDKGHVVVSMCAGPPGVPRYDTWLSQKLLLESDEEEFCTVAVTSRV